MQILEQLRFTNSFARLPEAFYARAEPTPLENARLVAFNHSAAQLIDLHPEEADRPEFLRWFSGEEKMPGSEPLAALYSGHQFGHYVSQLGDGRAIMLGEVTNQRGEPWEMQLKGAGLTDFSRSGDGRAVLRSTIREYLCSEAMHGLGIPTTRALCMIGSSEQVYRENIEDGAMLLRLAPSHVRFGSFEVFYYRNQFHRIRELADYVIRFHYPDLESTESPYAGLLERVIKRTAKLIAQWQLVGFAHGVMNTDNMSILGLTLDYGPFGFLDAYDPDYICNHSDHTGRYAFNQQPRIGLWNLSCLAQALLPLLNENDPEAAAERARELLQIYDPELRLAYARGMRAKLGLRETKPEDAKLAEDLLQIMARQRVDYTRLFRALSGVRANDANSDNQSRDLFMDRAAIDPWLERYRVRLQLESANDDDRSRQMNRVNPKYILRNYLAQQAIKEAEKGDYSEVERLLALLQHPFDEQSEMGQYAAEPPEWASGIALSCSS
ncbi:YdiU family protein [bacterium endosymbiont of Escarpia laminata]|nr:MAG: YdiU family protein [bacterium endosymbiont of Escarpia laminata]RLJ17462.1 MAG: YdiU family protein [bacterium endosymbiont of Escarpia laminata]